MKGGSFSTKIPSSSPQILTFFCFSKYLIPLIISSLLIFSYLFTFTTSPLPCSPNPTPILRISPSPPATDLRHIVFGIASSRSSFESRKHYIQLWWRPRMRGFIWLDRPLNSSSPSPSPSLPAFKISGATSEFPYTHKRGSRAALRIARVVAEAVRLGLPGVHWYVLCDDDTVFVPDNLVRALRRFDHRQPFYVGGRSESHLQNILFSYGMAYGGGGIAVSRPLAAALARMQDRCMRRYRSLYGGDDRIQACMAELGVPLTPHPGFHQFDVRGRVVGLLAAHPVAPLVSLHHLDVVDPIFPDSPSRAAAVRRLLDGPARLDSAGVMQQSICYDVERRWTVSVAWGYVVQVVRGVVLPREMERPARTFAGWHRREDDRGYAFNTRAVGRSGGCQRPVFYYLKGWLVEGNLSGVIVTRYSKGVEGRDKGCKWKLLDPSVVVEEVLVFKKADPSLWDRVSCLCTICHIDDVRFLCD